MSPDKGVSMELPLLSTPLDYDLREVVQGIFENMLNLSLTVEEAPSTLAGELITAVLKFKGSWTGVVTLSCGIDQARRLAGRFLALSADQLCDQLVSDVVGEIANMIAGNLKSVFANDIRLSLAQVTRGHSRFEPPFEPVIRHECAFQSAEGVFHVCVFAIIGEPRVPYGSRDAKTSDRHCSED
jgi:CheY-specific phosphatase CheX